MNTPKHISRKLFLSFAVSTPAAFVLGCGSDTSGPIAAGGAGGAPAGGAPAGGAGGSVTAGAPSVGGAGSGAGGASAGTTGSTAGAAGSSGAAGSAGSGGSSAGAGGSSAGAGGAPPAPDCSTQLKTSISSNHGHVFNVSNADVLAGVEKVYDTTGTATHPHWLQVTAADFAKLKAGGTVRKLSCNDGHEHEFIVNCEALSGTMGTLGISQYCDANHKCADTKTDFCPALPG